MQTVKCEVWLLVDESGDYVASHDSDALSDSYEENIQGCTEAGGMRRVKVTVEVPLPVPLECEATAPQEAEAAMAKAQ